MFDTTEARELAEEHIGCIGTIPSDDVREVVATLLAACDHIEQLQRGIEMVQYGGGLRGFDPQHDSLLERITKLGEEHNP